MNLQALSSMPHFAQLPNFIIAGAPTCGTTALHQYLCQHPQIFLSPIKEPTYFAAADMVTRDEFHRGIIRDRAALKEYLAGPMTTTARYWVTEWEDYLQLFRNVRGEVAIGESSVSYLWLPSAAAAIQAKLPRVRLIFLLRDPADRLFSWYNMRIRREPDTPLRDCLLREIRDGDRAPAGLLRQLDGGKYATHLRRFFDLFPSDQIRIHLHDRLRDDAPALLREVFGFLGIDPTTPINTSVRHNETLVPRFPTMHRWRRRLFGDASAPGWLPTTLRDPMRKLYLRPRGHLKMDPEDRALVINYYREEILMTQDLIGRDLSAWLN